MHSRLGDSLAELGDLKEASESFARAAALNPLDPATLMKFVQSLEYQGRIEASIKALESGINTMNKNGQFAIAQKLNSYLMRLKSKRN